MRTTIVLTFVFIVSLSLGCSESPQMDVASSGTPGAVATAQATDADQNFVPLAPLKVYDKPSESVRDFLNAITTGDDKTATSLLSYAAQRETWANGLALTSEGFPNTRFEITAEESVSDTVTHVETTWVDEQQNSYPCVWLLRKEQHGWCIFAMATKFMENANPVVLPFEDHAKLRKVQEAAMQQMRQQQMAANHQQQAASQISTQQPTTGQYDQIRQASGTREIR